MNDFLSALKSKLVFCTQLEHWRSFLTISNGVSLLFSLLGISAIAAGGLALVFQASALIRVTPSESAINELGQVTVSITGAVHQPGLYTLKTGDRVAQAITQAGGFTDQVDQAAITSLNLAQELTDGQQLVIPTVPSPIPLADRSSGTESKATGATTITINVNTAAQTELETLPGIGSVRAAAIVENRPYQSFQALVDKGALTATLLIKLEGQISL